MISIRSYKRREGRMIESRQRAVDELWLDYGITEQGPLDLDGLFGRQAPCHLEIGFGMGDTLLEMARTHPENNFKDQAPSLKNTGNGGWIIMSRKRIISTESTCFQEKHCRLSLFAVKWPCGSMKINFRAVILARPGIAVNMSSPDMTKTGYSSAGRTHQPS